MTLWSIFWRTFAALASAALLAFEGVDILNGDVRANVTLVGLGLLAAGGGALVAVLIAIGKKPATSALEKAIRAAVEKAAGVIGVFVYNSTADLVNDGRLLQAGIGAVVLAFAITYFGAQAPPVPPTAQ